MSDSSVPGSLQVGGERPDRNLALELVRVTEAAAMAAGRWVGRGDKNGADAAAVNATQAILQGARLRTAHGEVFMSAFDTAYSDAEIAAVLNYVTGRFSANTSAITPDEVAKRRTLPPSLTATMR